MKYPFFGKKGRPSSKEREICQKINQMINSGSISEQEIEEITSANGIPETEEDLESLYDILTGDSSSSSMENVEDVDYEDDTTSYQQSRTSQEPNMKQSNPTGNTNSGVDSNPISFTPFEEPVIERSYTKGVIGNDESNEDYSEENHNGEGVSFDEQDLQRPIDEDIPEPVWAGGFSSTGNNTSDENFGEEGSENEEDYSGEKLGGDNLEDLSPAQKRKSAEKTAEAILNMYCNFAPLPFKKWSSISDGKVQKLVFENKIDLNMQLENNVTVKDYIDGVNEQVDEVFKVSDETREEIKDPLIDVLLEQELALTPTQRLMLAVGSHLVTMTFSAFQLAQNNKVALETFEKYHRQMNESKTVTPSHSSSEPRQARTRPANDDSFSSADRESVESMMREMERAGSDDVLDENDPSIEVTEDYD